MMKIRINRNTIFNIIIIISIGILAYMLYYAFTSEHDKEPNSWVEDSDYEQIIVGEKSTNERIPNQSVNLLTPMRKKYIKSNENYIPKWQRTNKR